MGIVWMDKVLLVYSLLFDDRNSNPGDLEKTYETAKSEIRRYGSDPN